MAVLCTCLPSTGPIAQEKRDSVDFPNIPGYQTLKGDFHLHTVFSDGQVWPSFRVHEARRDGLDFIALTDHVDYQGNPTELPKDYNKPYELAMRAAKESGLLVIRGVEISPRTPPYHNNALFLEDANAIPSGYMADEAGRFVMKPNPTREELLAPFLAAAKQGAFIVYNHPGYLYDWDHEKMGVDLMTPLHKELVERGMLGGIEVVNSIRYYKKAHRLAMKYGLTLIASSDEHEDIAGRYKEVHRPMTLVFARERTVAGIKEALLDRRTVAYYEDFLIGRARELEPLFKSSIEVTTSEGNHNAEPLLLIHIRNRSSFPYRVKLRSTEYDFDTLPLGQVVLRPHETTTVALETLWDYPRNVSLQLDVENMVTGPDECLRTSLAIEPSWQNDR